MMKSGSKSDRLVNILECGNRRVDCGLTLLILMCFVGSLVSAEVERPGVAFSVTAVYAVTVPNTQSTNGEKASGSGEGSAEGQQRAPHEGQLVGTEPTPPINQLLCQPPQPSEEEEIAKQEQAARDLDKAVVGLEIAQGAIEITLGAIRIAAAATTADVIRREDAIAASRASASANTGAIGFDARVTTPEPIKFRHSRAAEEAKKRECDSPLQIVLADDAFTTWKYGYHQRMKRSALFGSMITEESHNFVKPTPNPKSNAYPMKLPSTEDAEHLLDLLENLLDTNNDVLRLLNIDLPPLTSQPSNPGAVLLHQYRQRLSRQRDIQRQYGQTGYLDEEKAQTVLEDDTRWKSSAGRRRDVHALSSELSHLNRMRRRLGTSVFRM